MKLWTIWLAALAVSIIAGCARSNLSAGTSPETAPQSPELLELGYALAKPVDSGNVRLIPIVSKKTVEPKADDVITLEVAKKNGWVEITESKEGTGYNSVFVKNNGPKPLLLVAGDLLLGGHQDRVVAHDTVIEPGQGMDVEVFCVEHGRSTGPTDHFEPSEVSVPHKVRQDVMFARDQDAVWGQVNSFNSMVSAAPPTETVQGGLTVPKVVQHIEANFDQLWPKLRDIENVVGYVLVVDGRIDSAEVFGSNATFLHAAPKLLRGILAQQGATMSTSGSNPPASDAARFLTNSLLGSRRGPVSGKNSPINVEGQKDEVGLELYRRPSSGNSPGTFVHGSFGFKGE